MWHTFSAFWLRSSVVSVLISVKTDNLSLTSLFSHQCLDPACSVRLRRSGTGGPGLTLPPGDADPFGGHPFLSTLPLSSGPTPFIYDPRKFFNHNFQISCGFVNFDMTLPSYWSISSRKLSISYSSFAFY